MSTINAVTLKSTTIQHTNGTSALNIDSSGRVTKPNHPAFYVQRGYGNLSNFMTGGTTAITTWDQINLNKGNHFTSANGRFTAPVAGVYLFTFHLSSSLSGTDNSDYLFYKNGGGVSETIVNKSGGVAVPWINSALIMHINLAINDYVTLGAASYNANTGTARASFGGCLIG